MSEPQQLIRGQLLSSHQILSQDAKHQGLIKPKTHLQLCHPQSRGKGNPSISPQPVSREPLKTMKPDGNNRALLLSGGSGPAQEQRAREAPSASHEQQEQGSPLSHSTAREPRQEVRLGSSSSANSRKRQGLENFLTCFQCVFYAFYCSSAMQIKNAGGIPTISHRISHSRLAAAPKPEFLHLKYCPVLFWDVT